MQQLKKSMGWFIKILGSITHDGYSDSKNITSFQAFVTSFTLSVLF
jgi:hypothetical protein